MTFNEFVIELNENPNDFKLNMMREMLAIVSTHPNYSEFEFGDVWNKIIKYTNETMK